MTEDEEKIAQLQKKLEEYKKLLLDLRDGPCGLCPEHIESVGKPIRVNCEPCDNIRKALKE